MERRHSRRAPPPYTPPPGWWGAATFKHAGLLEGLDTLAQQPSPPRGFPSPQFLPLTSQVMIGGVSRFPLTLPTPPTPKGWLAFALGRTSPMLCALLAASARLPLRSAAALAVGMVVTLAALQPAACAALPLNTRGIELYFVAAATRLNVAGQTAAAALVGTPLTPPPRPPCPPQACFATLTLLHAVATIGPAIATARGQRRGVLVWAVATLAALCAAPLLAPGRPPDGACPAVRTHHHDLMHLQVDPGDLRTPGQRWGRLVRYLGWRVGAWDFDDTHTAL